MDDLVFNINMLLVVIAIIAVFIIFVFRKKVKIAIKNNNDNNVKKYIVFAIKYLHCIPKYCSCHILVYIDYIFA